MRFTLRPTLLRFAAPVFFLAASAFASGPYHIGSANTVTAEPNVPRPSTTPCVVTLFSDFGFDNNYNLNPFSYTPPDECPGPWAKVILEVDINVTAGIQYDRTANIWLGGTNIFFGTTAEPGPTLAPSWHVENDLTDYSPIFSVAQTGSIYLGNTVNSTYTGIQYATAKLEFYPLTPGQTAPVTANVVLPLSGGPTGGTVALNTTSSTLSATLSLPTNIQNAYLDVYSQGQSNDEFWYACVPNDVTSELESCGNTGFRETEITIDGTPAGVAPVSPWIFTGGLGDPYLWFPIPGLQTLNFVPYRVDLTPFAGLLSNGSPHVISLSVFNADSYFSDTASLLLYLDAGSTSVTGEVTENTLTSAPSPVTTENINVGSTALTGTVSVGSNRNFVISGYVNTSHGKVATTLSQQIHFLNSQYFDISNTEYVQNINQASTVNSTTTVASPGQPTVTYLSQFGFPLVVDYAEVVFPSGAINVTTKTNQTYNLDQYTRQGGVFTYIGALSDTAHHQDTLHFNSSGAFVGNTQSSSQTYYRTDTTGVNVSCTLDAANNVLTSYSPTCAGFEK
jgi:peptide N-acetyl-beta-D-glucosaminyl asparaginase amidase A